uniref:soluble epoxide hydrolase n=1 Tax=Ananas comosus var. bracteatus TaxID=296719 RepID=A0A6V7NEI7_ANACO|nr:unnamed protein product [Ananas comosus var. bracteatus]
MHVAEKGPVDGAGTGILLLHGFPELWYSWRHQIVGLAARGYRAIAPDLRGYGDTSARRRLTPTPFSTSSATSSPSSTHSNSLRPDRVKALVNTSVAHMPRDPSVSLVHHFKHLYGDNYYVCRFQEPGVAEAEFAKVGTKNALRTMVTLRDPQQSFVTHKDWRSTGEEIALPSWLSEEDLDYYASKFEKTGFTGGMNYYRCLDLNWELTAPWAGAKIQVPTKFIVGDLDLTYHYPNIQDYIHKGGFKNEVPLLEEVVVLEGVGHFIQQERAEEVTDHIYNFIKKFQYQNILSGICNNQWTNKLSLQLHRSQMEGIVHRTVEINGIAMHVAEKGGDDAAAAAVLLLHGFPELWYSWRHQIVGLAARGYRAVAPDLRGYGCSAAPPSISSYSVFHAVGDLVGLLDALGLPQVFLVGHGWGALVAWNMCMFRPERVKALVNMSVAFSPRDPAVNPVQQFRNLYGDSYYICRFQEPGKAEAEFAAIGTRNILKRLFMTPKPSSLSEEGFGSTDNEISLPSWLSEDDFDYYASKFEETGFTGGLNYYRCLNLNWELTAPWTGAKIQVPTKFIVGDLDPTYHYPGIQDYLHNGGFKSDVPSLEEVVVLEGVGTSSSRRGHKKLLIISITSSRSS